MRPPRRRCHPLDRLPEGAGTFDAMIFGDVLTGAPRPAYSPSLPAASPSATPTVTPIPGSGPIVALDPGHGGEDLGARHFNRQGEMDLYESTITLALALRTGEKLKVRGFRVF